MTAALLAAGGAASSLLLLGVALANRDRDRVLRRAGEEDLQTRPRPAFTMPRRAPVVVAGGLGASLGWLVAGLPGLLCGSMAAGIPSLVDRRREARRARLIERQLVDAVAAVASAIRTGRSLVQALGDAAREVGEPLGAIVAEVMDRSALGVPLDEVLDTLSERIGGAEARLVTGVLRLHRRTGGALATALDDASRTLRARREGARELRSLTAQARLSAAILGLLPLGFFLFLSVVARRDVESAYHTATGASAIGVGLVLQGAAFVWIRHLLRVEDA